VTQAFERGEDRVSMAEAQLKTGRTHQIRVHLQKIGHPILGDDKYGIDDEDHRLKPKRLLLHAHLAGFIHPRTGEKMRIESPLPPDFTAFLKGFHPIKPETV
jgi:23S rRNA pseudouridine955/2504/2580 synthase